jgi:hypothetical protein
MESGVIHTDVKVVKDFTQKEDTITAGEDQKAVTLSITIKKVDNIFFFMSHELSYNIFF